MKTKCKNCLKEIDRRPSIIKKRNSFCGASCQLKWEYSNGIRDKFKITQKANIASRKKGIEKFKTNPSIYINKRGYKMIYIPSKGNMKYHHYIWEKSGRKIPKGFCLHHINHDKLDNRLSNLLLLTHEDHHKLHTKERKRDENGRFK